MTDYQLRYYHYKSHGICVRCGQMDARQGRLTCANCADTKSDRDRIYYQIKRDEINDRVKTGNRERYARRKAQGICVTCGKRTAAEGHTNCGICAAKARDKQYARAHRDGMRRSRQDQYDRVSCAYCRKPVVKGKCFCADCLEKKHRVLEKVGMVRNNRYWKLSNHTFFIKRY